MCGICGVVYSHPERPVDRNMLRHMTDILSHRGPDRDGYFIAPGVGFGVRRLSIIDLETGDQPISNEDETVTVVCNGEIYNFQELRQELLAAGHRFKTHSDVEVIVHLYEDYGVECVNHLRGMFGFALWDARHRRLMLARDRLGIKPLLYSLGTDGLFFGSELKSILMGGGIERQVDVHALKDLFTVGFVLAPKTLFSRIRQLLPGHYLLYQDGNLSLHKYWDLRFPVPGGDTPQRSAQEWSESLRAKLEESVRIHLRSDVPVGAWLSAGVDSSSVVSLMSRLTHRPVQTFTLAFENPRYDEVSRQKILKDFTGYNLSNQQAVCTTDDFKLLPKTVWHSEDPFSLGVGIPRMLLSQLASKNVKVVLTGEGSDEVFGGYSWFRAYKLIQPLTKLPFGLRRFIAQVPAIKKRWPRGSRILGATTEMNLARYKQIIDSGNSEFDYRIFSEDLKQRLINHEVTEDDLSLPQDFDKYHPFAQLQYFKMKVRLSDFIIRNLDATPMAYSLEVRVPFLDHELVEFCSEIPPTLKMRGIEEKYILRRAMRDILPSEIRQRRKPGLSAPYGQWFRDLPEFAVELLSEDQLRDNGYFNPKFVARMLELHQNDKANYARQLMGVLGIHLWDDLFLRGCRTD
ncbi:MAG: asparagine synthase (glutamine-hydrolyzing) [Thermodesulfobacteriota bacterium]